MIARAIEAIRAGQIVGLPTDTVYGVGVDPLNEEAVGLLFDVKGRPEHKPIGLLAASLQQAAVVGEIHGFAEELARRHWPGALTLIVRPKVILADWVGDTQTRTVGIRVPDHPVATELLLVTGPLSVTSANRSGEPETMSHEEAERVFGDGVAVYLPGRAPGGQASTVVDVSGAEAKVLRDGPVPIG